MVLEVLFVVFAVIAAGCALMMVTRSSPVASALWLIGTFFSLAAIYTLLGAFFIGIIQILVYAGAIMVLFLFVIMLLNLGNEFEADFRSGLWKVMAAGSSLVLVALLARMFGTGVAEPERDVVTPLVAQYGAVGAIGVPMFLNFSVALQVTGILLLVAVVGAVVLSKRNF